MSADRKAYPHSSPKHADSGENGVIAGIVESLLSDELLTPLRSSPRSDARPIPLADEAPAEA